MKSKEEIEQLANEYGYASAYSKEEHKAFINGYTQCQEDMADEIAELKMLCLEYSNIMLLR